MVFLVQWDVCRMDGSLVGTMDGSLRDVLFYIRTVCLRLGINGIYLVISCPDR